MKLKIKRKKIILNIFLIFIILSSIFITLNLFKDSVKKIKNNHSGIEEKGNKNLKFEDNRNDQTIIQKQYAPTYNERYLFESRREKEVLHNGSGYGGCDDFDGWDEGYDIQNTFTNGCSSYPNPLDTSKPIDSVYDVEYVIIDEFFQQLPGTTGGTYNAISEGEYRRYLSNTEKRFQNYKTSTNELTDYEITLEVFYKRYISYSGDYPHYVDHIFTNIFDYSLVLSNGTEILLFQYDHSKTITYWAPNNYIEDLNSFTIQSYINWEDGTPIIKTELSQKDGLLTYFSYYDSLEAPIEIGSNITFDYFKLYKKSQFGGTVGGWGVNKLMYQKSWIFVTNETFYGLNELVENVTASNNYKYQVPVGEKVFYSCNAFSGLGVQDGELFNRTMHNSIDLNIKLYNVDTLLYINLTIEHDPLSYYSFWWNYTFLSLGQYQIFIESQNIFGRFKYFELPTFEILPIAEVFPTESNLGIYSSDGFF